MIWIIGHFLAIGIGVSLGLLGGGGSVLALPVLVYVMGVAPKPAIAMTLIIVGTVSLLGSIPHARRGNLNLKTAVIFGTATMLGAYVGARIATLPMPKLPSPSTSYRIPSPEYVRSWAFQRLVCPACPPASSPLTTTSTSRPT